MTKAPDWNALWRALLLLSLAYLLVHLILTGQITRYIHPKFTWFTASASVGFLLMAGGQLVMGLRMSDGPGAPVRLRLYLVVAAVVCAGLLVRPHTFGADLATKQGLNVTNRASSSPGGDVPAVGLNSPESTAPSSPTSTMPPATPSGPIPAPPSSTAPTPPPSSTKPAEQPNTTAPSSSPPASSTSAPPPNAKLTLSGDTIVVTAQNFAAWMQEIYGNYTPYVGKQIVMDGFAFYAPQTAGEEFAVTRLVVTCHVAHAAPDGLLVYLPGKARPAEDSWHRVEGVLEPITWQGAKTLRIHVTKLTPIAQPADPYVYS